MIEKEKVVEGKSGMEQVSKRWKGGWSRDIGVSNWIWTVFLGFREWGLGWKFL